MAFKQIYKYISALFLIATFSACNTTKYVPEGSRLLMKNQIYVNGKKAKSEELYAILKQKPNKKIIFPSWKPYLTLYNWGNPDKEKGLSAWFTKIGEAPVIMDTTEVLRGMKQLGLYSFGQGYFHSQTYVKTRSNKKGNKVWVDYYINTGMPYYFGSLDYLIASEGIEELVRKHHTEAEINSGNIYNSETLEKERSRLVSIFRNNGYFGFQKSLIRFEADTSVGNRNVNLKMVISDQPIYYEDSTALIPHQPYRITNIYIDPDFSYTNNFKVKDTTRFETYIILDNKKNRYKPQLLTNSIHFEPNDIYNVDDVQDSYKHLTSLKLFRSTEIEFKPSDSVENGLDAFVRLRPFQKRSITFDTEVTNTSGNLGIFGSVSVLNRSLFKRGEIFDITLRGGIEKQFNVSTSSEDPFFNVYEYGIELGLNFPRFVLPYRWQKNFPKRMLPKTRLSTSYGKQRRQEFTRDYFNVGLGYFWNETEKKSHQIQLVDLSYIYLTDVEPGYVESLEFTQGFEDVFIFAIRYVFTYNDQKFGKSVNRSYFRGSVETAGNLLGVLDNAFGFPTHEKTDQGTIGNVAYAQYIKFDLDYRNYTKLRGEQQLAWRAYIGYTQTYGNSDSRNPPFEKSYFAGGSNDLRGWYAYELGPGNFNEHRVTDPETNEEERITAVAPIKLMLNLEYRFSILNSLKGGLFIDVGNIWNYNIEYKDDDGNLNNNSLYADDTKFWHKDFDIRKQLAVSPGLGLRYDFGFFVFRLDGAYPLYDPKKEEGDRLNWLPQTIKDVVWSFAIGYPF